MSKGRQSLGYGKPAQSVVTDTVKETPPKITNIASPETTPEEVKAVTSELNKDAQLHNAVLLCLSLLLTQARYGRIQREADVEIVAAIASLE